MATSYRKIAFDRQGAARLKELDAETQLADRVRRVARGAKVNTLNPGQRQTIRERIAALGISKVAERYGVTVPALEIIAAQPKPRARRHDVASQG